MENKTFVERVANIVKKKYEKYLYGFGQSYGIKMMAKQSAAEIAKIVEEMLLVGLGDDPITKEIRRRLKGGV